jgi:hypothetical protein
MFALSWNLLITQTPELNNRALLDIRSVLLENAV